MEGYREPDEKPVETQLAKCEKHGLAFDPKVQGGCTICRREATQVAMAASGPGSKGAKIAIVSALVISVGGWFGAQAFLRSKRAQVGARCEAQFGCVDGADCMAEGILPGPGGTCYRRCTADSECSGGQKCSGGHCLERAELFGWCRGASACPDGSECVTLVGKGPQCLKACGNGSECPDGSYCENVLDSMMPLERMMTRQYCLKTPQ